MSTTKAWLAGVVVALAAFVLLFAVVEHGITNRQEAKSQANAAAAESGCNYIDGETICIPNTTITRVNGR